jgi:O-antigen ligase
LKNEISQEVFGKELVIVIIILSIAFFFVSHDLHYSRDKESINKTIAYEEDVIEGSLQRRIALLSLGLISLLSLLFTKNSNHIDWKNPLGWVLLFFGVWSLASVIWTIDLALTVRRLAVFAIFCLGAMAIANRYSVNFIPVCVFYITTLYLATGLSVELVSQTFQPLTSDFRFSGTINPNIQGINCSMMLLAAVSLSKCSNRNHVFFLFAAGLAFLFLILTKSRTSLFSVLLTLLVFFILSSSLSKASVYLLGTLSIFGVFFLFLGDDLISIVKEYVFLGRFSSETLTLTGRTHLWETILNYVGMRPFHGHGFNSFWIPRHIQAVSYREGWSIPDAHSVYIDLLLNIGLVGLFSYLFIMFLGMKNAITKYFKAREIGYGFLMTILIFFSVHGLAESALIQISSLESFVFLWGLFCLAS